MNNVGDAPSKSDVCVIIHFLHLEGVLGNDIHCWLCNVFREGNVMLKHAVYQWIQQQFDANRVVVQNIEENLAKVLIVSILRDLPNITC